MHGGLNAEGEGGEGRGAGKGIPTEQTINTLRHPESRSLAIDFVFNRLLCDHTTQAHRFFFFFFLRLCHMFQYADGMVNNLRAMMCSKLLSSKGTPALLLSLHHTADRV